MSHTPLTGGEFLIKDALPEHIFIPEELDEEAKMMANAAAEFVENEVFPHLDAIDKQEEGLAVSLLEKAGALGLLGTALPEEYGGFGKDFNTNTAITSELGSSYAFGVSLAAHTGIGTLPILYYGTEEQKKNYLPKLATGELKAAYCLTEPSSGSDALAAKSKAILSDDGTHYILSGQKMWITNGGFADVFIVFAKIDGEHFTGFIVDGHTDGVTRGAEEHKMGIKGSSTRQIFFEQVKVPKANILGEVGKGHKIAFNILNIGRFKLCCMVTGGAKLNCTIATKYALERKQFDLQLVKFGAIRHKLAEQAIRIFASESATYRVSNLIQQKVEALKANGKPYHKALMGAAEEYAVECAILKVMGSEMLDYVVDETVQIHGGYGFSEEFPAARPYRDSRINRIFEGTNEINRLLAVDMVLRNAMKGDLPLLAAAKKVQGELMSIPDFGDAPEGLLANELTAIRSAKKAALLVAGAAAQKLMMKLKTEQEILMNIADMMIDIYTAESMILRVLKMNLAGETRTTYGDMAQVYTAEALERIHLNGKRAVAGFAEGDELRMLLLGVKRFTKLFPVNTKQLRRNIAKDMVESGSYCF